MLVNNCKAIKIKRDKEENEGKNDVTSKLRSGTINLPFQQDSMTNLLQTLP